MEFPKRLGLRGQNKLLKKLLETGTTAIDEAATLKACRIYLVFYSVISVHKLDIIRKEKIFRLHIYSAAALPNIIKIGQHLTE